MRIKVTSCLSLPEPPQCMKISNLLDNAVKYTPEGGRIEVAFDDQKDRVELAVSDNGGGVPTEDHCRIVAGVIDCGLVNERRPLGINSADA